MIARGVILCDDPNKVTTFVFGNYLLKSTIYSENPILSSQTLPGDEPIDEIHYTKSLASAGTIWYFSTLFASPVIVLYAFSYPCSTDHQIHFYTVPSLEDDQHLKRPPPSLSPPGVSVEAVDFVSSNGLHWPCLH